MHITVKERENPHDQSSGRVATRTPKLGTLCASDADPGTTRTSPPRWRCESRSRDSSLGLTDFDFLRRRDGDSDSILQNRKSRGAALTYTGSLEFPCRIGAKAPAGQLRFEVLHRVPENRSCQETCRDFGAKTSVDSKGVSPILEASYPCFRRNVAGRAGTALTTLRGRAKLLLKRSTVARSGG